MKNLLFFSALLISAFIGNAQLTPIMVCDAQGNNCTPYYDLTTAYNAADTGDYIYLPGGVYVFTPNIDKEIHVIGNGCHADSANVGGITLINGNISLSGTASGSSLEGLYLSGSINVVTPPINNLSIKHCNIYSFNGNASNSFFKWTIFRSGGPIDNNFGNGINNLISNCFLYSMFNVHSSTIDQCTGLYYLENLNYCTVKNCAMYYSGFTYYGYFGSNNIVKYNIYSMACPYQCISTIFFSNNQQESIANTFEANNYTYSNMHILSTSPAMTASENGGQVGVYGGAFPYKEGAVPGNPHIYFKNISSLTDANGNLPVNIKVRAENY